MPAEKARMVMEETKREDEEIDVGDELLKLMDQLDDLEEKKKRAKKRKRKATGVLPTMTDKDQKRAAEKVLERLEEKEERIRKRMRTLTGDEESEDASDPLKFLWE